MDNAKTAFCRKTYNIHGKAAFKDKSTFEAEITYGLMQSLNNNGK
jgi:hypothetical protein